jgi:ArsR family transcriptional regulator
MRSSCCRLKEEAVNLKNKILPVQGFLKLISDKTRLEILILLAEGKEHCVCELVSHLNLPQNLVSYHLKLLREAGLVQATRRGSWIFYSLSPDAEAKITQVFENFKNLISSEKGV